MPVISARKPYRIARSRTGLGLFATKPIEKGTTIIQYFGPKIPSKKADELENKYLFEINSRWTIDGSIRRNIARYINHACRPNAEPDIRGHKIFICATKAIAPGDEITYHYGKNYFDTFLKPIGCKCTTCLAKRKRERAEARAKAAKRKQRKSKQDTQRRVSAAGAKGKKHPGRAKSSGRRVKSLSRQAA